MSTPKDLRYSEEHEWVKDEGGNYRIGITTLHNLNLAISYSLSFHLLETTSKRTSLSEALSQLRQYLNFMHQLAVK